MFKKLMIGLLAVGLTAVSCGDDDDAIIVANASAGIISGGPFMFDVDGDPDMVSGITLNAVPASGESSTWDYLEH